MNKRTINRQSNWPAIILSIASVIFGIIAGPVIEAIVPPLFQGSNLLYLTFFINAFVFIIFGVYAITYWDKSNKAFQKTNEQLVELSRKLNVKFEYIDIGKGSGNYAEATHLIKIAEKEIMILNYGPVQRIEGKFSYDKQATSSTERKQYYDVMLQKIKDSSPTKFRFRRIIQLPRDQDLSKLEDPLMVEHLTKLAEIGSTRPEFVSLKKSQSFFNTTFMIVDRRHILFSISVLDPDHHEYYTKGHFSFDDPAGEFVNEFVRLFERIDAQSTLVTIKDLPLLNLAG